MAAYAPRRSSGPILRSTTPTAQTQPSLHSPTFASATSSAFNASRSLHRPSSPTRINLLTSPSRPSLSFPLDRTGSQNRFISMTTTTTVEKPAAAGQKRTCMCSPTNHPGSFRCSLHKAGTATRRAETASYGNSGRLNMRRSAMKNSLVRIGTVEGEWVKRALAALIRPSSHHQRRRGEFQPRRSRLSVMTKY
ncbi:serine-rich protein-like protein [Perilla frutescens var. hirtella]|nr:serine-rich protein-like protein [Perilla frutescens var. hirtella]KAH6772384.1 serine-rich protein-like protein [Perilla frutescens var. frutescens]